MPTTRAVTHRPHAHRVTMVVVPPEALAGLSLPGPKEPLTPELLKLAEEYVSSAEPAVIADPRTIVAIGSRVATPFHGRLVDHDDAIPHSMIRMWTESDVIEWEADTPFVILSVVKAEPATAIYSRDDSPDNPFYVGPPYASDSHHVVRSSIVKDTAHDQQYKVSIQIGGRTIDPDFVCGSPPPV
jgi:hypothetical protein